MSTEGSPSVSSSAVQPKSHVATATAELPFGHAYTFDPWQKKRSLSSGHVTETLASCRGNVAGLGKPLHSDGASRGSRTSSTFSIAQPLSQTFTRFQAHGQPGHVARPSVTSTAPETQRARPDGQSCLIATTEPISLERRGTGSWQRHAFADARMYKSEMKSDDKAGDERIKTFEEFWPYYVGEHSKKTTRTIHFVGTTAVMGLVAYAAVRRKVWPLLVAPFAGYGPAWFSHFFIEGNKPATFKYPLWSLKADFVMWSKIARGTMDAEVQRVAAEKRAKSETSTRSARSAAATS